MLLRRQFGYFEEQQGTDRAIRLFRKMAHWYLKAMRVSSELRNEYQTARTREELEAALAKISAAGPKGMNRDGVLPDLHVPVPNGPGTLVSSMSLPTASLKMLQARAALTQGLREFFISQGYWEVETPLISQDVCVDLWLDPVAVPVGGGQVRYCRPRPSSR